MQLTRRSAAAPDSLRTSARTVITADFSSKSKSDAVMYVPTVFRLLYSGSVKYMDGFMCRVTLPVMPPCTGLKSFWFHWKPSPELSPGVWPGRVSRT